MSLAGAFLSNSNKELFCDSYSPVFAVIIRVTNKHALSRLWAYSETAPFNEASE